MTAIVLSTASISNAASTHTVWTTQSYNGSASAYACAYSAAASATGYSESAFARAILANAVDRISTSDSADAGERATASASVYNLDGRNTYSVTTSYASAWIGDTEIVCSQYY